MAKRGRYRQARSGSRHARLHSVKAGGSANSRPPVDIFKDRRALSDRREEDLSIPDSMCRRADDRRKNSFNSRPWWLLVNYNDELSSPA